MEADVCEISQHFWSLAIHIEYCSIVVIVLLMIVNSSVSIRSTHYHFDSFESIFPFVISISLPNEMTTLSVLSLTVSDYFIST